jgi:hypothetical protein
MINEFVLKFSGAANIPQELDIDTDYSILLVGNVQSKDTRSNNDGSFQLVHKLKLTGDVIIQDKHGANVYGKAKNSPSQRFRSRLRTLYPNDDFDAFYERFMGWLIKEKSEDLYEEYYKIKE